MIRVGSSRTGHVRARRKVITARARFADSGHRPDEDSDHRNDGRKAEGGDAARQDPMMLAPAQQACSEEMVALAWSVCGQSARASYASPSAQVLTREGAARSGNSRDGPHRVSGPGGGGHRWQVSRPPNMSHRSR